MKKISKRKALILLSVGLLVITSSQITSLYTELSDFTSGTFIGVGMGILLTALIFGNFKTVRK